MVLLRAADEARRGRLEWCSFIVILGVVMGLRQLSPGDTQWIHDEPRFLARAAEMVHGGGISGEGFRGSIGLTYGPVAIWIFAGLMRVSNDLVTIAALRTALFDVLLAIGLIWLTACARRLRPIAAPILLLSPYAWLYARQIWDNTWLIPLGTLALAAHVSFDRSPARYKAWVTGLALVLGLLIHPMFVPFVAAVGIHSFSKHRKWWRQHPYTAAAMAAVSLLIALPWLVASFNLLTGHADAVVAAAPPALQPPKDPHQPWYASSIFGLLGGRVFSASGLEYFLEPGWTNGSALLSAAVLASVLVFVLVWVGVVRSMLRVRAAGGFRAAGELGAGHTLDVVCLYAFGIQWLFLAVLGRHTHPHYYNGLWICYGYFLWSAVSEPLSTPGLTKLFRAGSFALAAVLAFTTFSVASRLHRLGGTRGIHFGATLSNQIDVAHVLGRSGPDAPLTVDVANWLMFPHALTVLRQLVNAPGVPGGSREPLRVHYRDPDPNSGWIVVSKDR
ncbi:MAG TPA: hypothetical protein VIK01_26350 [Polyangiaceae bacterium]